MTPRYEISTPYGDRYLIHDNGDIECTDIPGFKPSEEWQMVALVSAVSNRRIYIAFDCLSDFLATTPDWLFKNGKPRYTVRDFDHGTIGEWGNTTHHGVARIREI